MGNKIQNIKDLKGKTISDVKLDGDMYIKFTDNSFVVLKVNDISEGFGYTKNEVNICDETMDYTDHNLVDLNLISKKEHEDAVEQEELEYKKLQEKREQERLDYIKKVELEQLEILKSKYK